VTWLPNNYYGYTHTARLQRIPGSVALSNNSLAAVQAEIRSSP